jgi:two-component system LytT family response regulator
MPFMNGFELLNRLAPIYFDIIFVTAYDQYAANEIQYKQNILHKSFGTSITNQRIELFNKSYTNKIKVEISDLASESGTQVLIQINI